MQDVGKRYAGGIEALHATTLDIRSGEFLSLLGPSGSGKTTLLRLVGGFEVPSAGRVFLDGRDVTRVPAERRNVNTVFQNYALFPHMTVAENVGYPLLVRGVERREKAIRVGDALALVGLAGYDRRLPHELSGGQRQRAALARALIGRPRVLLLDEPLGALDLQLRQQMQVVLARLHRELGITFVFVTHDQSEALAMSDRIAVMKEGRILQADTPQQLYFAPRSRFVASFLGNSNLIDGSVEPDGGHFRIAGTDIHIRLARPAKPGLATLSVRSEALAVRLGPVPTNGDDATSFPAVIEGVFFRGESVEVRLGAGSELTAIVHGPAATAIREGLSVTVSIRPEDALVLNE